jgi:hypothetical protein
VKNYLKELLNAEEGVIETDHKEIFKAVCSRKLSKQDLDNKISHLFELVENGNQESVRFLLQKIVPTYTFNEDSHTELNKLPARATQAVG